MDKNVLILSASPRKGGNSDTLCGEFIRGCQEAGNRVEKIDVREREINFCLACYRCRDTGECVQKDDMLEIGRKMTEADVIVLATPVYFYSMCGQMKTLIDRSFAYGEKLRNKGFYFIATAADGKNEMKRTIDGLSGFTDCLPDARVKGVILGAGAWKMGDIQGNPAMREAYETGKSV